MRTIKKILLIIFITIFPAMAMAQFYNGYQMSFGKNRVQYIDPFWSLHRSEKFDAYFYTNGSELATFTIRYADAVIKQIEKKLDYRLEGKIQFIVFNKLSDLKQSNIGLTGDQEYNIGGITHIIDSKVFLYFDGNHAEFQKQIRAGIANVIVNQMMFGEKVSAMIKNSALLILPEWYIQGLIAYLSEDWSTKTDDYIRENIRSNNFRKFNALTGMQASYAGHSLWKYISLKYGHATVSNIVYMTKVSKNVESGFLFVLGKSFSSLIEEWLDFFESRYNIDPKTDNISGEPLFPKPNKNVVYQQVKICPDGDNIAYTTNDAGRWKVKITNISTKKNKTLLRSGQRLDEKTDYSNPILTWHPTGKILSIIFEHKGKILMYFYNLEDRKFQKMRLFDTEKVLSSSFAQNGRMMVMSAVFNGQSDIYIYNLVSHSYEAITKDIWDDLDPTFINNSEEIIFSSNRSNDTIRHDIPTNLFSYKDTINELSSSFSLFIYNYKNHSSVLRKADNKFYANQLQAIEYDKRHFAYLSDENGIYNRYIGRIDSTIAFIDTATHYRYYTTSYPITNYPGNIIEQDINIQAKKTSDIIFINNRYYIYINDIIPVNQLKPVTLKNTFYINEIIKEENNRKNDTSSLSPQDIEYLKQKKIKETEKTQKETNVLLNEYYEYSDTAKIDINDYHFGAEKPNTTSKNDSIKTEKTNTLFTRAENYDVEYSLNQLVSQIDFNFLNTTYQSYTGGYLPIYLNPGFNGLLKLGVIDLLEDYRITGGYRLSVDLDNNEFYLSFDNFKKRLDKTLVLHRQSMKNISDYSVIKSITHDIQYSAKWPFNNIFSFKATGIARWDKTVYTSTDIYNLLTPTVNAYWGGVNCNLTFDNTRPRGLNIYYGTRWKIFGEYYHEIKGEERNLVVLGVDFRNYKKLHKTLIWANRLSAGSSFGKTPLIFYLGGTDNWVFPKFDTDIPPNDSMNYAFQTLATNMRGFNQNIRNGNNFAVFNSEIRFPIIKYFAKKPIKSDFFNNLQLTCFGDLGMAWIGINPFSEENTVFKEYVQQGPILVTIRTLRDPLVGGSGLGIRTRILGYFVKLDYAWGIEKFKFNKPILYLSLSTDF